MSAVQQAQLEFVQSSEAAAEGEEPGSLHVVLLSTNGFPWPQGGEISGGNNLSPGTMLQKVCDLLPKDYPATKKYC